MEMFSALLVFCEGNPQTIHRASNVERLYFCGYPKEDIGQAIEFLSVIWDAMALIWRHRNNPQEEEEGWMKNTYNYYGK